MVRCSIFDHLGTTKILVNDECRITWPRPGNKTNELLPFGYIKAILQGKCWNDPVNRIDPDGEELCWQLAKDLADDFASSFSIQLGHIRRIG
ncbi:hypothetical protein K8T06_00370 [bacterium]|nr:hypothetical protein [bacterium]